METIQRLIDGELDDAQRQDLLQHLDEEAPESWRDLALGFLEARLLDEAFRSCREEQPAIATPGGSYLKSRLWGLAAALVLGLGFGFLMSPSREEPQTASAPLREQTEQLPQYGTVLMGSADSEPLQIPVFDATGDSDDMQQALHLASEPMRRIGAAYSGQGLEPELSTTYISAELDDGKYFILPVSHLTILRPSGRAHRRGD